MNLKSMGKSHVFPIRCTNEGLKGSTFALFSGTASAISFAIIKALTDKFKISFVTAARCVLQIPLCLAYIAFTSKEFYPREKKERKYFIFRIIMEGLATLFNNIALHYLPLFDGMAFFYFILFLVSNILSCIVLKEKISACNAVALVILTVGIVLICQPSFIFPEILESETTTTNHVIGYIMMFLTGSCHSISLLAIRRMPVTGSDTVSLYGFMVTLVLSGVYIPLESGNISSIEAQDCGVMLAACFAHLFHTLAEIYALKLITVSEFEVLVVVDLPAGMLLDILWFRNYPNAIGYIGGAMTILCILVKSCYEFKRSTEKQLAENDSDEEAVLLADQNDVSPE